MFKVHGFLDDRKLMDTYIPHLPRTGDTVRINEKRYVVVTEVIWCMDERDALNAQRVNLRFAPLTDEPET